MMSRTKQKAFRDWARHSFKCVLTTVMTAAAAVLVCQVSAEAQDYGAFHEIETKYIFGNFTVGSSTGIEGEKAFEPETQANFGKRGGRYSVGQTALEFEYTPTQYMQIEFGPSVSYYNIRNVPGLDDRNEVAVNGFEAALRSVIIDRGASPFAVTLSLEPEFHSRDETSGAKVVNYGLEAKLEADTELIKNRLFLGFNLLYEPETTTRRSWHVEQRVNLRGFFGVRISDYPQCRDRRRSLVFAPLRWHLLQFLHRRRGLSRADILLEDCSQGSDERGLGSADRRARGRCWVQPRFDRFFPFARKIAARIRVLKQVEAEGEFRDRLFRN
jgi:hypothetical protein